jgi:TonB-dependent SusC/RagA subfamily outer membrane receptor
MKRLVRYLFGGLLILLVSPTTAIAQQGAVEGLVTDSKTQEALPGANVQLVEIRRGAATNVDGTFEITQVPAGMYTLRVSFIGYKASTQSVEVTAGETTTADVTLEPDLTGLEEIVVTGLATQSLKTETSVAVSRVNAAQLTDDNSYQSIDQLIGGNAPGVSASASSGNVGSGVRFRVRGGGGLNGDGQPVIYIDGVRIDNEEVVGFGAGGQGISALADLDPENIESIEILKGSASTAIYGTEGSEGVVLITTKNGQPGQDFSVQYKQTLGFSQEVRDYDADRFISADAVNALWQDPEDATQWETAVTASGSAGGVNYLGSITHRVDNGIIPNNRGERTNFRANFEALPSEEVSLRGSASYTLNDLQRPDNDNNIFGFLGNTLLAPGGQPYFFTDSTSVTLINDVQNVQRFIGSFTASYSPRWLDGLQLRGTGGYDVSSRRQDRNFPVEGSYSGVTDGERNSFVRNNRRYNLDGSARYSYELRPDLSASTIVGGQALQVRTRTFFGTAQEFNTGLITNIGSGANLISIDEDFLNTRQAGLFAQQEFSFLDTYSLSATIRRDYASLVGEDASAIWYPSVQGNVRLNQFGFVPDAFDLLKLRAAYGESGELPALVDVQALRFQAEASGSGPGATISSVGDVGLEPERVREFEVGVDASLFDRYSLEATYYRQFTSNTIIDFQPSPSTGFGQEVVPRNAGDVLNQGLELGIGLTPYRTSRHQIDIDLNYSYRTTEVQDLGGAPPIAGPFDLNYQVEGEPKNVFYTFEVLGAQFDEAGNYLGPRLLRDEAGELIRTAQGAPAPDHFGGLRLNVRLFRNLNISGFAEYQLGQQVFNNTELFAADFGNSKRRSDLQTRLSELEPGTDAYRETATQLAFTNPDFDGNYIEDANWLKIREISVRYDFSDLLQRAGVRQVRDLSLALAGRNLFTFTEYSGPDPEVNFDGARGQIQGQDFLTLQTSRQFSLILALGF